jgi:hypothetical protein
MQVFTRTLNYADDDGTEREVVLTVFLPFEATQGGWKCEFTFDPPIYRATPRGGGVDFIHAFVVGLRTARIFLESTNLWGRVHWQGMSDCGLPSVADKPTNTSPIAPILAEDAGHRLSVLAARKLGYPDDAGVERETILTLYVPFQKSDVWKCGFVFDLWPDTSVRYGVGADAIEAALDALAGARGIFESKIPVGWEGSEDLLDCADFPVKNGQAFCITR